MVIINFNDRPIALTTIDIIAKITFGVIFSRDVIGTNQIRKFIVAIYQ